MTWRLLSKLQGFSTAPDATEWVSQRQRVKQFDPGRHSHSCGQNSHVATPNFRGHGNVVTKTRRK